MHFMHIRVHLPVHGAHLCMHSTARGCPPALPRPFSLHGPYTAGTGHPGAVPRPLEGAHMVPAAAPAPSSIARWAHAAHTHRYLPAQEVADPASAKQSKPENDLCTNTFAWPWHNHQKCDMTSPADTAPTAPNAPRPQNTICESSLYSTVIPFHLSCSSLNTEHCATFPCFALLAVLCPIFAILAHLHGCNIGNVPWAEP